MPENSKWLYTIPLNSSPADLAAVGGKGINLMRLAQANFPVPPGFILTTVAYREFFDTHQFAPRVQQTLQQAAQTGLDDPETLEAASASIRVLFETADFLPGAADELRRRYVELGSPPVAVRSSATAEDLPELSFAGQQDTYLNVIGADELIRAVMRCWGSLWTARAIGYRARNGVDHLEAALAVVVQQMVDSRVSGVMFTVNPVSGLRSETVIDVVNGLGEGLVSGRVAPDHYVVDTASGRLVEKTLGAKAEAARPAPQGGVIWTAEAASDRQVPGDDLIQTLAEMGSRVAALYGAPQDIEWAEENGSIFLLQTRAVTSLFPVPAGMGADPLKVLFSFAAVQGVLDPITPMGRSMLSML
ncbi:MAG: PEP/pyruvate-binding domain-containing protein, partial [Anaerolineaceae bacterium]